MCRDGETALRKLLVTSSLSGSGILEEIAVQSSAGEFCAPNETKSCLWSDRKCHPRDRRICPLTDLSIHSEFGTTGPYPYLQRLAELLNGVGRSADEPQVWETVASCIVDKLKGGRCRVEAAVLSTDRLHLAVCAEVSTFLGFRVRYAGCLYSLADQSVVGQVTLGQRTIRGMVRD